MKRCSFLMMIPLVLMLGCVDTAEPTGPVPDPAPQDPGELTAQPPAGPASSTTTTAAETRRRSR